VAGKRSVCVCGVVHGGGGDQTCHPPQRVLLQAQGCVTSSAAGPTARSGLGHPLLCSPPPSILLPPLPPPAHHHPSPVGHCQSKG
jgi:hypothetical protein